METGPTANIAMINLRRDNLADRALFILIGKQFVTRLRLTAGSKTCRILAWQVKITQSVLPVRDCGIIPGPESTVGKFSQDRRVPCRSERAVVLGDFVHALGKM